MTQAGTVLLDNYDSFTYNIVQYLEEMGETPAVFENDRITVGELQRLNFANLIISPGPGNPARAGICLEAVQAFYAAKKILGVCLGHQCIAQFFGAEVVRAREPVHGKASGIFFEEGEPLFNRIPQGFLAARYHSLTVDPLTIGGDIRAIARTKDGVNMALKHRAYPVYGVQFHPEAILTEHGKQLLRNFLFGPG
ncbi:MAG: aminodeoxychorismate/anthranilate synthase component II [Spirochaetaceae bacterium]|jgi:anthranilate synthase/aminodeoxychorismate synthase-like glutamine amidotransferase|nr:aminodeoxychorismate/anthranilate synthase component II [Spirochaetaceae bacterium]